METRTRRDGGFVRAILVIALALVVLKYAFRFDLLTIFDDPRVAPYFDKVFAFTNKFWDQYVFPYLKLVIKYALIAWEYIWGWIQAGMAILRVWAGKAYPEFLRPW